MEMLLDKLVNTERLTQVAYEDIELYATYKTNVSCNIQPLDDSFTEDLEGSYGKDFLMFTREDDIKQEDKIIDGDDSYRVVGVENYDWLGKSHTEVRIRRI